MKFNRSEIMTAAWRKYRFFSITFAQALRLAWVEAKLNGARFTLWGQRIGGRPELIASGVNDDRAGELEWLNKYRYDRIWRVMAA